MAIYDILMACVGLIICAAIASAIAVLLMIIAWRHYDINVDIENECEEE